MVQTTGAGAGFRRKQNHGAVILPPVLSYYQHPETIADMTRHIVGKTLDLFDLPVPGFTRWTGLDG